MVEFKDSRESLSDEQLMMRVKEGDMKAFEILMKRYQSPLQNFIYRMVGDKEVSKDIFQDTFLRLYKYAKNYTPKSSFSTFLYTIASNLSINYLKKKKIRNFKPMHFEDNPERELLDIQESRFVQSPLTPLEQLERDEVVKIMREAIAKLKPKHRLVLILSEYENLPYQEIAKIANCSVGTVKSRIHRAKKKIKEWLIKNGLL